MQAAIYCCLQREGIAQVGIFELRQGWLLLAWQIRGVYAGLAVCVQSVHIIVAPSHGVHSVRGLHALRSAFC